MCVQFESSLRNIFNRNNWALHKNICTKMFITLLFIKANIGKIKCPSVKKSDDTFMN